MAQTLTSICFHVVFSTKNREPVITDAIKARLHAYLGGITREYGAIPIRINGIDDHVHELIETTATFVLPDFMRTLKANSSKWVHETFPSARAFAWQSGYAAFSVSRSNVPAVKKYIADQEKHHQRINFQDELVAFLERHGVKYDPKFIWA